MPNRSTFRTNEEYNEYFRKYRLQNAEKIREYNRVYNQKWRAENGYHNEIKSQSKYPEKRRARVNFRATIYRGLVKRKPCEVCKKPNAQAHHNDYSKQHQVKWFCPLHHMALHKMIKDIHRNVKENLS